MKFVKYVKSLFVCLGLLLHFGCADTDFLDKTKINGSILNGDTVDSSDPISERTVLIAQNFDFKNSRLEYFGLCSGVIINANTIVTAAHCAENYKRSRVVTTQSAYSKITKKQIYSIKDVIIHYRYLNPETGKVDLRYDIALLILDQKIKGQAYNNFDHTSPTTQQYLENEPSNSVTAQIAGFGKNRFNDSLVTDDETPLMPSNGILLKAQVQVNQGQFKTPVITIEKNGLSGACTGDSGGPLFTVRKDNKMYLQGIAVAVVNSAKTNDKNQNKICSQQSLYLNLDFCKDWISKKLMVFSH